MSVEPARAAHLVGAVQDIDQLKEAARALKKIADGDAWQMPATIDDPAILDEIGTALKRKGAATTVG